MLYKIADLIVEVPEAGGMAPRCRDYLYSGNDGADITIRTDLYRQEPYPNWPYDQIAYMESGRQFYRTLLDFDGMMLHSSAVELDGKAYLFSGDCGAGKSTHTSLWQSTFENKPQIFNDDKPALRLVDGKWYAYGTPWSGKNGINQNKKVPLAGICFMKQAPENRITRLSMIEATKRIIKQTLKRRMEADQISKVIMLVDHLIRTIPVFELENRPEPEAALLSYETMRHAAEELGL